MIYMKRINITIDEELLNRIDFYAKQRYLSRSGLISLALSIFLKIPVFSSDVDESLKIVWVFLSINKDALKSIINTTIIIGIIILLFFFFLYI